VQAQAFQPDQPARWYVENRQQLLQLILVKNVAMLAVPSSEQGVLLDLLCRHSQTSH
jgi:hypothetical protein